MAEEVAMSVVVRAEDIAANVRSEYFHEVVGAAFGPLEMRTGEGNAVPDQVRLSRSRDDPRR
jgi:hypothetical protein